MFPEPQSSASAREGQADSPAARKASGGNPGEHATAAIVPFGRGRRSRKSRGRAVGAPARASRGRRSLGRVQAAVARVASRSAPRGHPLRPASGIFGNKPSAWPPPSAMRCFLVRSARLGSAGWGCAACARRRLALRARTRAVAGRPGASFRRRLTPAHTASAPHPASRRRPRAPRAPTPAAPRRSPLLGGPGRRSFAGAPRGGTPARPPTRDGGRTRRGPRASGVATAGGCGAGCGASGRAAPDSGTASREPMPHAPLPLANAPGTPCWRGRASVRRQKVGNVQGGGYRRARSSAAWRRTTEVSFSPPSMRASSSTRASPSTGEMEV